MANLPQYWQVEQGLRIPSKLNPAREAWDKAYHERVKDYFLNRDEEFVEHVVPIEDIEGSHNVIPGHPRTAGYTRMYAAGDHPPPMVGYKKGHRFHLLDGNRRLGAASDAGVTHVKVLVATKKASQTKPRARTATPHAYTVSAPGKLRARPLKRSQEVEGYGVDPLLKKESEAKDAPELPEHIERAMAAVTAPGVLIDSQRRPKYRGHPNPLAGHCFVATETLFHLINGRNTGWQMCVIPKAHLGGDDTHWFLRHKKTGTILDPTASQFEGEDIPYEHGNPCGTSKTGPDPFAPTKRADETLTRARAWLSKSKKFKKAEYEAWRGEHGANPEPGKFQSRHAALSFGTKDTAENYAHSPNDTVQDKRAVQPRVMRANLTIKNPFVNDPEDPFIDLKHISDKLGIDAAHDVLDRLGEHVENTNAYDELRQSYENRGEDFFSARDMVAAHPEALHSLIVSAYPVFDDHSLVARMKAAGYDGAIHGGSGDFSANQPEYKVFDHSQAQVLGKASKWPQAKPQEGMYGAIKAKPIPRLPPLAVEKRPEFQAWHGEEGLKHPKTGRPLRVFHGTKSGIEGENFDTDMGSSQLAWFSAHPSMANGYADAREGGTVTPAYLRGKFFDYRKHGTQEAIDYMQGGGYAGLDYGDDRRLAADYYGIMQDQVDPEKHPYGGEEFVTHVESGSWPALEDWGFLNHLKRKGYAGILHHEGGNLNYGVFRPEHSVKSPFSRAFDPEHPDMNKEEVDAELSKMARFTEPRPVYRVENDAGEGPYEGGAFTGTDWRNWSSRLFPAGHALADVPALKKRPDSDLREDVLQPPPHMDTGLNLKDQQWWDSRLNDPKKKANTVFGFDTPEHALRWFGDLGLRDMHRSGFKLRQVMANQGAVSRYSGQVIFEPHETYQPGKAPSYNWLPHAQGLFEKKPHKAFAAPLEATTTRPHPEPPQGMYEGFESPTKKSEHWLYKSMEPMAKMALVHDDPKNPKEVYRVQDEQGAGPYGWGSHQSGSAVSRLIPRGKPELRYTDEREESPNPPPYGDLPEVEVDEAQTGDELYGFASPEHALKWFGDKGLATLAEHGYHLTKVPAAKVWEGKHQAVFHPNTAYQAEKFDWREYLNSLGQGKGTEIINRFPRVQELSGLKLPGLTKAAPTGMVSPVGPSLIRRNEQNGAEGWDYSHLLPIPARAMGYGLVVQHHPGTKNISAHVTHDWSPVGQVAAYLRGPEVTVAHAYVKGIDPEVGRHVSHQGKGLATSMMAAVKEHAAMLGAQRLSGGAHSTIMSRIHRKISGGNYVAERNIGKGTQYPTEKVWQDTEPHEMDSKYAPYSYPIEKAEGFNPSDHPRDPETGEFVATDSTAVPGHYEEDEDGNPTIWVPHDEKWKQEERERRAADPELRAIEEWRRKRALKAKAAKLGIRVVKHEFGDDIAKRISAQTGLTADDAMPVGANALYREYKAHGHNPEAHGLRYLIHRIENVDRYDDPASAAAEDAQWEKNRADYLARADEASGEQWSMDELHSLVANQDLVHEVLFNRDRLHAQLLKKGAVGLGSAGPHVPLSRGLKREGQRPLETTTVSYTDKPNLVKTLDWVERFHNHYVPLKNVWYAYDMGADEAFPGNYRGSEGEYLVSPHEHKVASITDENYFKVEHVPLNGLRNSPDDFRPHLEQKKNPHRAKASGMKLASGIAKKSELDPYEPAAAAIMVQNGLGQVLWGRRRKDGKWCMPGGHIEAGEQPTDAAIRELHEETGITVPVMFNLGAANTKNIPVHRFMAVEPMGTPTNTNDPDREFDSFAWVDCFHGLPTEMYGSLAHGQDDVFVNMMGWQQPAGELGKNEHLDSLYSRSVATRKQYGAKSSAWIHPVSGKVVPGKGFIHDPADLDGHEDGDWQRGYILKDGSFLDAKTFDDLGTWRDQHGDDLGKAAPTGMKKPRQVEESPEFKRFFEGSKVVDPKGKPQKVFHGTIHDIKQFSAGRGNPENYHGRQHYFTSNPKDAAANYGNHMGPDRRTRHENLDELRDRNVEEDVIAAEQKKLRPTAGPNVMPVYLAMKNPVHLTPEGGTRFHIEQEYNPETDEYGAESGNGVDLMHAIRSVSRQYGADGDQVWENLTSNYTEDLLGGSGLTAHSLEEALRNNEELADALQDADTGASLRGDFIADIYKQLGHDGIVVDAHKYFTNMPHMVPGTNHYVVFNPRHIKSAIGNKGTFSTRSPNITKVELGSAKQVGEQMGSNPGGVFNIKGKDHYVKFAHSPDHARNEHLAAKLYEATGHQAVSIEHLDDQAGTASPMIPIRPLDFNNPKHRKMAHEGFATHAWLANWDAVVNDNTAIHENKPIVMDTGGALLFRAQGAPKGKAFGDKVTEFDTLRDPDMNWASHKVFGDMTPKDLQGSVSKVAAVPDETITRLCLEHGPGDLKARKALAEKLIARKNHLSSLV